MLLNYLKVALRGIRRNKGYSFINIGGLAIGLACFFLIGLWVRDELSFDRFHQNKDRIYRVLNKLPNGDQIPNPTYALAPALKELYPETGGQPNIPTVLCFRGAWDADAVRLLADHGISAGRWVEVLGRGATERDAAHRFHALHRAWRAERGRVV